MIALEQRVDVLADLLVANGELTDPRWRAALHAVPRHLFVPTVAWVSPYGGDEHRIDRDADPDGWWEAAYADCAIITQKGDGALDISDAAGGFTSSLSAPGVVLDFLELLDPYDHDEILEIGTGTGWSAGLLSSLVGDGNVTSVEVDPDVAKDAAANLEVAGFAPNLVVGDGATIRPDGGPFDRVHVTCGVTTVPYGWVELTRPGGVIVFPWMPAYQGGHKAKLTVRGDGTAVGRFAHGGAGYMMLRSQRAPYPRPHGEAPRDGSTLLDPRRVFRSSYGADLAITAMLPGVYDTTTTNDDGSFEVQLWNGGSLAQVHYSPDYKQSTVWQSGPRDLWDEVEDAYFRWLGWGSPDRDRFGLTVSPDAQHIWLGDPGRVIRKE